MSFSIKRHTNTHTMVLQDFGNTSTRNMHAHTHTKTTSSSEQQSPAIAAFTTAHKTQNAALSKNSRNVLCTLFFSTRQDPSETVKDSETTVLPTCTVWPSRSPGREGRDPPGGSPLYVQPLPPVAQWPGQRRKGASAAGCCREATQPAVCDGREMLLFVVMALISHLMS